MACLLFYGTVRFIKLETFDDTDIMESSADAFYDADFVFDEDLMFAYGITAYDSNQANIEDPSIGQLKPYYKTWGIIPDKSGVDFEELPRRNCTEAELHIEGQSDPNSAFYKPHHGSISDLTYYKRKMSCIDSEKLNIQGDYNSLTTRSFVLLFERCRNDTFTGVCKSDEEITVWLRRKFVVVLWN